MGEVEKGNLFFAKELYAPVMATKKRGRRRTQAEEEAEEEQELGALEEGGGEGFIGIYSTQEFDAMDPSAREDYIAHCKEYGVDATVFEARHNELIRRGWSKVAELVRMAPEEDTDGNRIKGLIRRFNEPDELQIREYAMKHCGGGTYRIFYYDDQRHIRANVQFEVAGRPKTAREQEDNRRDVDREERAQAAAAPTAQADPEKQFLRAELDRLNKETTTRRIDKLEDLIAKLAEKPAVAPEPRQSTADLVTAFGTALATAAPLLKLFVGDKNSGTDQMKMMVEMVEKTQKQQQDSLEKLAKNLKKEEGGPMAAATSKMLDLAIAKAMGAGDTDPQAIVMDIMKKMVPNLVDRSLEIAQLKAESDGGEKSMGERLLDQVSGLVEPLVASAAGRGAQAAGHMMPTQPMQPTQPGTPQPGAIGYQPVRTGAPMPGTMGNPNGPQVAPPQPGVYPHSTATPQQMPGAAPQQMPAQATPQPVAPTPVPPVAPVAPNPVAPQAPGAEAPAPAPDPSAHVQPAFYDLLLAYVQRGLGGHDLAEAVDDQVEKVQKGTDPGPPLLSEWAIEQLETVHPRLAVQFALSRAEPEKIAPFVEPTSQQIYPQVLAVLDDFARHFYDSENSDGAESDAPESSSDEPVPDLPIATEPSADAAVTIDEPVAPTMAPSAEETA